MLYSLSQFLLCVCVCVCVCDCVCVCVHNKSNIFDSQLVQKLVLIKIFLQLQPDGKLKILTRVEPLGAHQHKKNLLVQNRRKNQKCIKKYQEEKSTKSKCFTKLRCSKFKMTR